VARWVAARLALRKGVTTRLWDPLELPFGNLQLRVREMPSVPPALEEFRQDIVNADGFVLVTPEYNFGLPGALKNLLDLFFVEWHHKPFALVGAGGISGGYRALDTLRIIVPGLVGVTIPTVLPVHRVETTFGPNGPVSDVADWEQRADRLFVQLEWYARALQRARAEGLPGAPARTG